MAYARNVLSLKAIYQSFRCKCSQSVLSSFRTAREIAQTEGRRKSQAKTALSKLFELPDSFFVSQSQHETAFIIFECSFHPR